MKRSNLTIAIYLLLVFASGIVVGIFGYRLYSGATPVSAAKSHGKPSPEEWRRQYLSEMQTRLHLSGDQVTQLNTILDSTRAKFHDAHQRSDTAIKQIRDEQIGRVQAILTPEQIAEYAKIRAEREARAERRK